MTAAKAFTMARPSFGDELVHVCNQVEADDTFDQINTGERAYCYNRSINAIRAVLKAF